MTECFARRPKRHSYITDDDNNIKTAKGTKKCAIKRILKFNDYKDCLFKYKTILKSQQRFKNEAHCKYAEEINKIALRCNDNRRLQTFGRITKYPHGANAFDVCESEMLSKYK